MVWQELNLQSKVNVTPIKKISDMSAQEVIDLYNDSTEKSLLMRVIQILEDTTNAK